MKILHLTLHKKAFEVMITGEKPHEFRKPSVWMLRRLINPYTHVKFVNGYGNNRPYFICEYKGYGFNTTAFCRTYSNGLKVEVNVYDWVLYLGPITEKGNIK